MKRITAILVTVLAGTLWGQNPDVIQNTKNQLQTVQKKETAAIDAALGTGNSADSQKKAGAQTKPAAGQPAAKPSTAIQAKPASVPAQTSAAAKPAVVAQAKPTTVPAKPAPSAQAKPAVVATKPAVAPVKATSAAPKVAVASSRPASSAPASKPGTQASAPVAKAAAPAKTNSAPAPAAVAKQATPAKPVAAAPAKVMAVAPAKPVSASPTHPTVPVPVQSKPATAVAKPATPATGKTVAVVPVTTGTGAHVASVPPAKTAPATKPATPAKPATEAKAAPKATEEAKADTGKAATSKVPEPETEKKQSYATANGRRDPFVSPIVQKIGGSGCNTGKRCLAIDQIALKGIIKSENGMIAVVVNSADKAYFLRENDPVFNGYVVKITGDSVVFQETFQDRLGKMLTREVTKKITVPAV